MQAFLFKRKLQKLFAEYAIQKLSDDGDCMLMIVNHEGKLITAAYYENEHAAYSTVQLLQTIFQAIDNNGKTIHPKTAEQFFSAFLEEYKKIKAKQLADEESTTDKDFSEKEKNDEKN